MTRKVLGEVAVDGLRLLQGDRASRPGDGDPGRPTGAVSATCSEYSGG